MKTIVYHGSHQIVKCPELRTAKFAKDFAAGFYCTILENQAIRWATRYPGTGYVSCYSYERDASLNVKHFDGMTEEWLDFIAHCRSGDSHEFDIVEGPMANDTIFNYVQDYVDGRISREAFWALAKFKHPTHQISFHTQNALKTLTFEEYKAYDM